MREVSSARPDQLPGLDESQKAMLRRAEERARVAAASTSLADRLWVWVLVVGAGTAGYALGHIYSSGADETNVVAFYWVALSGVLIVVLDGARDSVKLAVGSLTLLNAAV